MVHHLALLLIVALPTICDVTTATSVLRSDKLANASSEWFSVMIDRRLNQPKGLSLTHGTNLAVHKQTWSSSNYDGAGNYHSRAVDGRRNGHRIDHSCWYSMAGEWMSWWVVDLSREYYVTRVDIYTRSDGYAYQASHAVVGLTNTPPYVSPPVMGKYEICGRGPSNAAIGEIFNIFCRSSGNKYRYVIVQKGLTVQSENGLLALCEVEVFGHSSE